MKYRIVEKVYEGDFHMFWIQEKRWFGWRACDIRGNASFAFTLNHAEESLKRHIEQVERSKIPTKINNVYTVEV